MKSAVVVYLRGMKKRNLYRMRSKLFLLVVPLVVTAVVTSGVLSSLTIRESLLKAANRHLAYKAEQLRDYVYSEWDVVEKLALAELDRYREAAEKSFVSYATSLLRTESERVYIFDTQGSVLYGLSLSLASADGSTHGTALSGELPSPGWFSGKLLGEERVGVVFFFEPFGWTLAITESNENFFSGLRRILAAQALTLVVSIAVSIAFMTAYVSHIVRPVERLSDTIENIASTHNLSHRAQVEQDDEIGFIAERFNNMISTLQVYQEQLSRTSLAEVRAREKAVQSELETLYLLGRVSDFRDEQTGEHQGRISSLTRLFSELLGHDAARQESIMNGSRLHDIGKIAIPDSVLLKPSGLTSEEYETVKAHTVLGYHLLKGSRSEILAEGAVIAYTHHERWDGTGYPRALKGEEIPLAGRIVSIVDVFDALISERPYKSAWSTDRALAYIHDHKGTQFDPDLVGIFINNFERFADILSEFDI